MALRVCLAGEGREVAVILLLKVFMGIKMKYFLSGYKYIKMSSVINLYNPSVRVSHTHIHKQRH